ncbi:MAG: hypothetical protein ACOY9J_03365 [Pseudomonadota bacterium]
MSEPRPVPVHTTLDSRTDLKRVDSARIAKETEAFLKAGGSIRTEPPARSPAVFGHCEEDRKRVMDMRKRARGGSP